MIKKELQLELNRTKLILDYARQEIEDKDKEIEGLKSIMKEVRDYIEPFVALDNDIMLKGRMLKPVLEILDKNRGENNGS